MPLNDGTAEGKPDPCSICLGRKERIEDPVRLRAVAREPRPRHADARTLQGARM